MVNRPCIASRWNFVSFSGSREQAQTFFQFARDAGVTLLRVGQTMLHESDAFYGLADEYGRLIWQDFAFANFDCPTDAAFTASVQREAEQFLSRTQRFALLGVHCCGSKADQQGAMLGLPPERRAQTSFKQQLPSIVAALRPDVPYVIRRACPRVRLGPPRGRSPRARASRTTTAYYGVLRRTTAWALTSGRSKTLVVRGRDRLAVARPAAWCN